MNKELERVIKLRKKGSTQKEIAKELNISVNKVKVLLQKLIDEELIPRKRKSAYSQLKGSIFNRKVPARKFIPLWHFNNNEQLARYFRIKPREVSRYSECVKLNFDILGIKYDNYNPIEKLNVSEKDLLHLINKEYSKNEIMKVLNLTNDSLIECVEYMNYKEDEKARKARRKEPIKLLATNEELADLYAKYNDYDAAEELGIGHSTFGRKIQQLKELGEIKPKSRKKK